MWWKKKNLLFNLKQFNVLLFKVDSYVSEVQLVVFLWEEQGLVEL